VEQAASAVGVFAVLAALAMLSGQPDRPTFMPPAADTLAPRGVNVITVRLPGLIEADVIVRPTSRHAITCRVESPDRYVRLRDEGEAGCRLRWIVPATGPYHIEIENQSESFVPYVMSVK
jgi:hypothetical protein